MSLNSWKKEFYPITAETEADALRPSKQPAGATAFPGLIPIKDQLPLLDSSIRKWSGTTKENLQAHGVTYGNRCLTDKEGGDAFVFDGDDCTLCHAVPDPAGCECCIIHFVVGRSCTKEFVLARDSPMPMLNLLKTVRSIATEKLNKSELGEKN